MNENSSNVNFNVRYVNTDGNLNNNNLWNVNSSGTVNNNNPSYAVRFVASINWGYIINDYIRDNIETNYCPLIRKANYKIKIVKYIC